MVRPPPFYFTTSDSIVIERHEAVYIITKDGIWVIPEMGDPYFIPNASMKWPIGKGPHFVASKMALATSILATTVGEEGLGKIQASAKETAFASIKEMEVMANAIADYATKKAASKVEK